jgi:hypothetical protein
MNRRTCFYAPRLLLKEEQEEQEQQDEQEEQEEESFLTLQQT